MASTGLVTWKSVLLSSGVTFVAGFSAYRVWKWYKRYSKACKDKSTQINICSSWVEWTTHESLFLSVLKRSKVLGLDCEWVTVDDERHPVALLQLAPSGSLCFLIRLCCLHPEEIPHTLLHVLEDHSVLKVGVNVIEDAQKLLNDYGWNVRNCLDLRYLVRGDPEFKHIWNRGLRALAGRVLNININKSVEISCSNWETEMLSPEQVTYAVEDAIIAFQIFEKLCLSTHEETWFHLPFRESQCLLNEEHKKYIDVPYKVYSVDKKLSVRPLCKSKAEALFAKARKNPNFDNCFIVAPDNEPLCTCNKTKANWYLEKELGELVCEDPFIVRLNFEPSGRPILDNKYYIQEKKSGCAVCGSNDHIFKKTVVPHEYRKYFPQLMTKNLSHDVLSLCVTCHRESNAHDNKLRNELAEECDAPIGNGTRMKHQEDAKLRKIKSAAKILLKSNNIPPKKKEQFIKIIQEHTGVAEISENILKEVSQINTFIVNDNYIPHGLKVYQYMCKNGGLTALEARWRKHFLNTMQPRFLPVMWSVDHNHERLALQVITREVDFDVSILGISQETFEKVRNM